ncbi:sodium/calcium exchanger protein [Chloropicon primus]|uniref:Sodium/calcium exchanger protein n=1 Tax=Chloropicon primus TaxID=1764295 RepID=A0A5B8MUX1_9CHLO|nr:sodium/calcium exchanger protein [Chloropicon primus]UPR03581.1 sodium/calcium exchanger protein [Chloropicon primus]|eukprot:QDZ24373.1 sodium/calcium exchanger protein [Chloropicon primus]
MEHEYGIGDVFGTIIPSCSPSVNTSCAESYYDKGYVVYDKYKECYDSWIMLPGFLLLPDELLALVFFFVLIYCFFGVAIISDIFMESIDVITEKEKVVTRKTANGDIIQFSVKYWNPTIANLTLMALGSSAPEIMLALIETIMSLDQEPGKLGPSTIVGSAAFNLLAISSVCVFAIPTGETRSIEELTVFKCTSFFSVFAYIWLYIVYAVWTPDEITIVESVITFLFFPLMVLLAYQCSKYDNRKAAAARAKEKLEETDTEREKAEAKATKELKLEDIEDAVSGKGQGKKAKRRSNASVISISMETAGGVMMSADRSRIAALLKMAGDEKVDTEAASNKIYMSEAVPEVGKSWNKLKFRMNAVRGLTGQRHLTLAEKMSQRSKGNQILPTVEEREEPSSPLGKKKVKRVSAFMKTKYDKPVFFFNSSTYAVKESEGSVKVIVRRGGPLDSTCAVEYYTEDGTAESPADYLAVDGILKFSAGQEMAEIEIPIVDDDLPEADESFFVCLKNASPENASILQQQVEVTIIDDDMPGIFAFKQSTYSVTETADVVELDVLRKRGSTGVVSVRYETVADTAVEGKEFQHSEGVLTFDQYEIRKPISITLINEEQLQDVKLFKVKLTDAQGGATISKRTHAVVKVKPDERIDEIARRLSRLMKEKKDILSRRKEEKEWVSAWRNQFIEAMIPSGATYINENGEEEPPSAAEAVMHYISISWKLIFAIVPPAELYGGWVAFFTSLLFIGAITAIVAAFAELFGCMVGLKDEITAISFVALGTSLPDTFASRQAALQCDNADAAIGNVTGSNSVNVFLGLGLPWLLASVYYNAKGEKYLVSGADKLGFSVAVFSIEAALAIGVFFLSRLKRFGGGELGGTYNQKLYKGIFFISLWVLYLILSGLYIYEDI